VAVVGGEGLALRGMGMTGAALLAGSAALHGGAGRVLVSLLDQDHATEIHTQPELMLRRFEALELESLSGCGCGGGQAVRTVLPAVLQRAQALVLDADALNIISTDGALQQALTARSARQRPTVLTPIRWRPRGCCTPQPHRCKPTGSWRPANWQKIPVHSGSQGVRHGHCPPRRHSAHQSHRQWEPGHGGHGDVLCRAHRRRAGRRHATIGRLSGAVLAHGEVADAWPR
jgi:hypothetical protein